MDSPHRQGRRSTRYPLHLPVSLKLADDEMHARSENISLGGILLSSSFLIPEGSTVELAILMRVPDSGPFLRGRGKVLRVTDSCEDRGADSQTGRGCLVSDLWLGAGREVRTQHGSARNGVQAQAGSVPCRTQRF
jgi:hypothetical protein